MIQGFIKTTRIETFVYSAFFCFLAAASLLRAGDKTESGREMTAKVLKKVGPAGRRMRIQLERLCQADARGDDPRWLELYVKACRLRGSLARLEQLDLEALRLAILDHAETFPRRYSRCDEYLAVLGDYQRRLSEIQDASTQDDESFRLLIEPQIASH